MMPGGPDQPGSFMTGCTAIAVLTSLSTYFDLRHLIRNNGKRVIDYLVERFHDGRFSLPVARIFPLDKCEEMFAAIRSASFSGKLCLKIR